MTNELLVAGGSLCLLLGLVEAWLLVALSLNPHGKLAGWIPGRDDLLKSHIDYLLMSMLLYLFYLLFSHFQLHVPPLLLAVMLFGSLGNPLLFLLRAMRPVWKEAPSVRFRVLMGISCLLTTLGYAGGAGLVASAALRLA